MSETMMDDEQYLRALGAAMKGAPRLDGSLDDPRWERLAAGTLSDEEDQALQALAQADSQVAETYEAFRPLGPDFEAGMAARLVQAADTGVSRAATPLRLVERGEAESSSPMGARRAVSAPPARHRRARRAGLAAAIGLAVAASWLLFAPTTTLPPLPGFGLEVRGGEVAVRSPEAQSQGAIELVPDSLVRLTLRPATKVDGPVAAMAFALGEAGPRSVASAPVIGETGVVTIEGTAREVLALPPGAYTLVVLLGRPGDIPGDLAAAVSRLDSPGPLQVFRQPLRIVR